LREVYADVLVLAIIEYNSLNLAVYEAQGNPLIKFARRQRFVADALHRVKHAVGISGVAKDAENHVMIGHCCSPCGLRRHEAVQLDVASLQQREEHWAIVDLKGKAGHMRTVPIPAWVKGLIDEWLSAACLAEGRIFRRVNKAGNVSQCPISEKAVWHVVRQYAAKVGLGKLAPHDLRRTCARLCHARGGELEQIQFLLGHVSIQTIERYLGCKQRIKAAVNDHIGIEPP
jgi:integrase